MNPRFQDAGLDGTGGAIFSKLVFGRAFLLWGGKMYLIQQKRKWLLGIAVVHRRQMLGLPDSAQQGLPTRKPERQKWPQASLNAEASAEFLKIR